MLSGRLPVVCLIFLLPVLANGQTETAEAKPKPQRPTSYWPTGVEFNTDITTPREFFGFRIGQRHLDHAKLTAYLQKLAVESERITIQQYGTTHGGRPLLLLTVSSTENLKNINSIRRQHKLLADPKRSADVDLQGLPAVINMGYGVHGDEASATNCAALVAHYLAAAKGDEIDGWLEKCVVLFDPCLNPDGFNRFANWVNDYRGLVANADPQHREHNQSWPAGRVNYYWFDLNRDWLPLEQPESQSRMRWYHSWKPNVVLDFHEMGTDSTYFFQPGVPKRTNPLTPMKNLELTAKFGNYHAQALDSRGSLFFTKELFDYFYMGKGSTYPDLHGAVGILFEQASARGHVQKNQDGQLRFHEAIGNHFTTSLSSLRATTDLRTELLEYKRSFYEESLATADKKPLTAFAFTCQNNSSRLYSFAETLMRHDIRCFKPKQTVDIGGKTLTEDSVIVPLKQPEYRFLQSLLMRRKNFQENIFYDVSCWTLPLAYGLSQTNLKGELDFELLEPVSNESVGQPGFEADEKAVAYAVDWRSDHAVTLLNELLNRNINVRVATRPFSVSTNVDSTKAEDNVRQFERGTLIVPLGVQKNRRKQIERMLARAAREHVHSYPVYSGLSIDGTDLGSNRLKRIAKPNVLLAVGRGVSQYGAGEIWHLLDAKHQIQVTMAGNPGKVDLQPYSTLVFPAGTYRGVSENDWKAIADRVQNGATAIAIGASCERILSKLKPPKKPSDENEVSADNIETANEIDTKEKKTSEEAAKTQTQLPFDSAAETMALQLISGAILQAKIDRTHPLF